MFSTRSLPSSRLSLQQLSLFFLLILCLPSPARAENGTEPLQEATIELRLQSTIENLTNIQQAIDTKQNTIGDLRVKQKKLDDNSEKQEIELKIGRIKNEIASLQQSFEHIALGSINRSVLNDQPEQKINWQDEIEQISRPLLSSLKELTAKPRQIDSLRRETERLETQIKVIDKALESIHSLQNTSLPAMMTDPLIQLSIDWQQRREDTQRKLEISR